MRKYRNCGSGLSCLTFGLKCEGLPASAETIGLRDDDFFANVLVFFPATASGGCMLLLQTLSRYQGKQTCKLGAETKSTRQFAL